MSKDWARIVDLSTQSLNDLAENRIAAIKVPNFATAEECVEFAVALQDQPLEYYKVGRPAGYVGTTFIQFMNQPKNEYFGHVDTAFSAVHNVTSRSFNPLERFIETVNKNTEFKLDVAQEPGFGRYFAGIIRILSGGNNIHIDFAPQWAKDHIVGSISAQLTWNVYIDQAEHGGETTIWNKPWDWTGDLEIDSKYPEFTLDGLSDAESFVFKAEPGSVMIFNSRLPHQVNVTKDHSCLNRIGVGSFLGRADEHKLVAWS